MLKKLIPFVVVLLLCIATTQIAQAGYAPQIPEATAVTFGSQIGYTAEQVSWIFASQEAIDGMNLIFETNLNTHAMRMKVGDTSSFAYSADPAVDAVAQTVSDFFGKAGMPKIK